MDKRVFKQFEIARGWSIEVSESMSNEIINVRPNGFKNTIHWQIGHILTSTEYFLFELPRNENGLPANYIELFGSGTKPDVGKGDVPSLYQLISQLKEQLDRIREISATDLSKALLKPKHGFETMADCAGFSVLHEVLHIGKMEEMKRIIVHSRSN